MKILIAEDDVSFRYLLKNLFLMKFKTAHIALTSDGKIAVKKYLTWQPNAVITDQYMPNMTGIELAEFIRSIDTEIPIILLSGSILEVKHQHLFTAVFDKSKYTEAVNFLADKISMDRYLCPKCSFIGPHIRKLYCWICGNCRFVLKKPL